MKRSVFWLFGFAAFMMITGDFPKVLSEPLGFRTLLNFFSWRSLYLVAFALSFLALAMGKGIAGNPFGSIKFLLPSLAALLATFALSSAFSAEPRLSFQALGLFSGCLFFFLMSHLALASFNDRQILLLRNAIIAAVAFLALRVVFWRLRTGLEIEEVIIDNNNWWSKNHIAGVLILTMPLVLAETLNRSGGLWKHTSLAAFLLGILSFFLLIARNGILALACSSFLLLVLTRSHWKKWIWIPLVCALIGFAFQNRLKTKLIWRDAYAMSPAGKLANKEVQWKASLAMFKDHPVTGIGLGTIDRITFSRYAFDFPDDFIALFKDRGYHPHNIFIYILTETGLLGFSAFLYFWAVFIGTILNKGNFSVISAGLLACFAGFLVYGLFDVLVAVRNFASLRMNLCFWFMAALALRVKSPPLPERT